MMDKNIDILQNIWKCLENKIEKKMNQQQEKVRSSELKRNKRFCIVSTN